MANPEIKITFNAETGKASKSVQDLYNKIQNLEKTRGADFTDKEVQKINALIETYSKYEHKVVKFNEYVRHINATEFSNETTRDKTLENTERKYYKILSYGLQIASQIQEIGIKPRELESFVNLANTLNVANKELDVAIQNKERLLNQPKAPSNPLVTSYPWENEAPTDNKKTPETQFKNRYSAVASDIESYQKTLEVTISSTERLKGAFREQYAALKDTDEGYLQQKQLLESLIVASDKQLLSLNKLRGGIQGQISDFEQLYKTTNNSKYWLTGLKELEERLPNVAEMSQKIEIAARNSVNIQNKYNNVQLKNYEKNTKAEQKYQSVLETTGMTYQELTQLYSQLLALRQRGGLSAEEIQKIDGKLTAVRKNITLMGREAQLSGAKMIGAQTSVLGVMNQVVNQWRNGTLTLKGLTQGIKLFAKSTVVLAAIQFAWEGISWAMEKAKTAIFGTADAEKKAADEAKRLSDESKKASENLLNTQHALSAWRFNEAQKKESDAFLQSIKEQNEAFSKQIELINEIRVERLYEEAQETTGKSREIALDKIELQRKKIAGLISEKKYQKQLIDLEYKAVQIKNESAVNQKKIEKESADKKLEEARSALQEARNAPRVNMQGFEEDEEIVKKKIATYQENKAYLDENREEYVGLKQREARIQKKLNIFDPTTIIYQNAAKELQKIKAFELTEKENAELYNNIPKLVREFGINNYGLSAYTNKRNLLKNEKQTQESLEKTLDDEVRKAKKESEAKTKELNKINQATRDETSFEFTLKEKKIENIKEEEKQEKLNKKNKKQIADLKNNLDRMTLSELQSEQRTMQNRIVRTKNSKKRERLEGVAEIYTGEIEKRLDRARSTVEKATQGKYARTDKEQSVMDDAATLLEKIAANEQYKRADFEKAKELLRQANKTSGLADNSVVYQLIDFMNTTATAINKNRQQYAKLGREVQRFKNKLSDPTR